MAVYQRLLAELDANGQKLLGADFGDGFDRSGGARVRMPEQIGDILAHFGQDHFLERYQHYKANIGEWRQQYPKLAAVDLRYEQQVVLDAIGNQRGAGRGGDPNAERRCKRRTKQACTSYPAGELQADKESRPAKAVSGNPARRRQAGEERTG